MKTKTLYPEERYNVKVKLILCLTKHHVMKPYSLLN